MNDICNKILYGLPCEFDTVFSKNVQFHDPSAKFVGVMVIPRRLLSLWFSNWIFSVMLVFIGVRVWYCGCNWARCGYGFFCHPLNEITTLQKPFFLPESILFQLFILQTNVQWTNGRYGWIVWFFGPFLLRPVQDMGWNAFFKTLLPIIFFVKKFMCCDPAVYCLLTTIVYRSLF